MTQIAFLAYPGFTALVKWRGLIAARRASSSTVCGRPGSASLISCTSRIESRRARGIHTGAANCVCPPGRGSYSNSQRATVCATLVPG